MDKIFRAYVTETKAVDADLGIYEAMISTESVDRQGDIVVATGAQLGNFLKNPVVLWAHDYYQPPVARALSVEIVPGVGIRSTFQFPQWGESPQADIVRRLWSAGFLNATSIGFIPLSAQPMNDDQVWGPQKFTEWELLEYSIVPVPANQDALRLAMKSLVPDTKRGRVLSGANEKRLREAADLINGVLAQLGEAPEEEQLPESSSDTEYPVGAKSNTDPTPNDMDEATLEALNIFLSTLKNGAH